MNAKKLRSSKGNYRYFQTSKDYVSFEDNDILDTKITTLQ